MNPFESPQRSEDETEKQEASGKDREDDFYFEEEERTSHRDMGVKEIEIPTFKDGAEEDTPEVTEKREKIKERFGETVETLGDHIAEKTARFRSGIEQGLKNLRNNTDLLEKYVEKFNAGIVPSQEYIARKAAQKDKAKKQESIVQTQESLLEDKAEEDRQIRAKSFKELMEKMEERGDLSKEESKEGELKASVPLMITREQKQALLDKGYSRKEVRSMKPGAAHSILGTQEVTATEEAEQDTSQEEQEGGQKTQERDTEKKPLSRGEKRAERLKQWEEMSEEERREKYSIKGYGAKDGKKVSEEIRQEMSDKRYERAERLYAFERARVNFIEIEAELNKRNTFVGKTLEKLGISKAEQSLEDLQETYEAVLIAYKEQRAGVVGSRTWSALNEKMRFAEQEAMRHQEGTFEKLREKWRWLGEQNLEKLLSGTKLEPKGKVTKTLTRFASLRAVAGLGLVGGGMAVGFGSAAGISALAARRVMGGTSAAFGSYDLMSQAREKQDLSFNKESIEVLDLNNIQKKMVAFEARAKFSGERLVHNSDYHLLRKEYIKRTESWLNNETEMARALRFLDEKLQEKQSLVAKEEKHRKLVAAGVGIASIAAFSASSIQEMLSGTEFSDIDPSAVQEAAEKAPVLPVDSVQEAVEVEGALPPGVTEAAESLKVPATPEVVPEPQNVITTAPEELSEVIEKQELTPPPEITPPPVVEDATTITAEAVGTVKEGGSAWQAAHDMMESGAITKEQFKEAWSSASSVVELESGRTIHISELGLTHAGDQVMYVPASGGIPAHFKVIDYAKDSLYVGSNEDLAAAFKAEGKDIPQWLQDALGASETPVEAPEPEIEIAGIEQFFQQKEVPLEPIVTAEAEEIMSSQEVLEKAAEGALEVSKKTYEVPGGTAKFIMDNEGAIADIQFSDIFNEDTRRGVYVAQETIERYPETGLRFTPNLSRRVRLLNKATERFLQPDYRSILEIRSGKGVVGDYLFVGQMHAVKERAWELFKLHELLSESSLSNVERNFVEAKIKNLWAKSLQMYGEDMFKKP